MRSFNYHCKAGNSHSYIIQKGLHYKIINRLASCCSGLISGVVLLRISTECLCLVCNINYFEIERNYFIRKCIHFPMTMCCVTYLPLLSSCCRFNSILFVCYFFPSVLFLNIHSSYVKRQLALHGRQHFIIKIGCKISLPTKPRRFIQHLQFTYNIGISNLKTRVT